MHIPCVVRTSRALPLRLAACFFLFVLAAFGQATTGAIEGRVINAATGEFLEGAQLALEEDAGLRASTDEDGYFRLAGVPAGTVRVRVFYTGLAPLVQTVAVGAGAVVQLELRLSPPGADVVKLDEFVVATSREMTGAALAINEQRFADRMMTVVSTDEFGQVAEGNVAEFLKFLPGVEIGYIGGNAREVSLNGVPSDYVPVTLGGFNLASASGDTNARRHIQADMISINNLSRIEVSFSPTPESPGSALAGTVNMVPRSAFERSKPVRHFSTYLMMRAHETGLGRTAGPRQYPTRHVLPGADFSFIVPVSKTFGYTLSGGRSAQYSPQDRIEMDWRGAALVTNGGAFPHTTPDKPYVSTVTVRDEPKITMRHSLGLTLDWRLARDDRLSLGLQYSSFDVYFMNHAVNFNVVNVAPDGFSLDHTHGKAGAGNITVNHNERNRYNHTFMPTLLWRHDGPVWKAEVGAGVSRQNDDNKDHELGFFRQTTMRRTGVTVRFDEIGYLRPRTITVIDNATGAVVDPYSINEYTVTAATGAKRVTIDEQRTLFASVRRGFHGAVPFQLKAGVDLRQSLRDIDTDAPAYTWVGADGRPTTIPRNGDDSAAPFLDPLFSQRVMPFGFSQFQTLSNNALYRHYLANPRHLTLNANTSYRNNVTDSKRIEELISAGYVRGDLPLFNSRVKLVGGLRAEQTNIDALGPLSDPTGNYARNPDGSIAHDAAGRPVPLVPTTDAYGVSRLTYLERGNRVKREYLRWFPSLNGSWNVRENLIARASVSRSIGRPNVNQYAGGLTLPDIEAGHSPTNRIEVNNASIKPWEATSQSVRVEYYFEGVGQLSIGAFRRDFRNFFRATVFKPTPEFLETYGLDPDTYGAYDAEAQSNVPGRVRLTGWTLNYRHSLAFVAPWARGLQVFANLSSQNASGAEADHFAGYVPRSINWGASYTREKYNLRVNVNYRGRQRRGAVAEGVGIEPGTYNWGTARRYVDVLGEYNLRRNLAVFFNLRNVFNATEDYEIYGPSTPESARFAQRTDYRPLWTFGIKGTF